MPIEEIIKLVGLLAQLIPAGQKIVSDLRQSGEMTKAQKKQLDDAIDGTALDPAWQPD